MKTIYEKTAENNKLLVTRTFNAPLEPVWNAWTRPDLLDQWWAPLPWKTKTKSMDFKPGGKWIYSMNGPDGESHYAFIHYKEIAAQHSFKAVDGFCDENGNPKNEMPEMKWNTTFNQNSDTTVVKIESTFASQADLQKIVEMGFEEGFAMAHDNLDVLLASS